MALVPFLIYGVFLLVGCWPVNRGFQPTPGGTAIYVLSSAVHTDLIVPIDNEAFNWTESLPLTGFPKDVGWATHYAIGWGDRGFYLETPTWDEMKASTALRALVMPSDSVVHVQATFHPEKNPHLARIELSADQYMALCQSMLTSFTIDHPQPIADEHYNNADAFYEGRGSYSCFYTCNSWAGDRLKEAGVCVPMWTPLPGSTTWYVD